LVLLVLPVGAIKTFTDYDVVKLEIIVGVAALMDNLYLVEELKSYLVDTGHAEWLISFKEVIFKGLTESLLNNK